MRLSFGWNDESAIALLLADDEVTNYVYGLYGVPLERLGYSATGDPVPPTLYLHTDQQDSIRLATDTNGNAAFGDGSECSGQLRYVW